MNEQPTPNIILEQDNLENTSVMKPVFKKIEEIADSNIPIVDDMEDANRVNLNGNVNASTNQQGNSVSNNINNPAFQANGGQNLSSEQANAGTAQDNSGNQNYGIADL